VIFILTKTKTAKPKEQAFANISAKSFIMVVAILLVILILSGTLSYFVPQGHFEAVTQADGEIAQVYVPGQIKGISFGRVLTAPARVFGSEDGITIIMISVFLLVMSGVFNILDKTGGIKVFLKSILGRVRDKGGPVVCITVLVFMLFGSLFGMFEELVTLLPLVIMFMLSMKMDTMMGLGACLLAACFGFSTAITNPFSVGTAAQIAEVPASSGAWLRIVFFVIVYLVLCAFLMLYLKKIEQHPERSLTYEADLKKRQDLRDSEETAPENQKRTFRVYTAFFAIQGALLVAIACIRAISGFAIPILAASFLISGLICGGLVCRNFGRILTWFLKGAVTMVPAVLMIAIASSVKLVMEESGIIDTVIHYVEDLLGGKSKFVTILLLYALILFLQLFIGSASAKIFLVMPIVLPIAEGLGISKNLLILTYCMADGFTDVILPTNPVLLIGLSMANVSYWKWLKWTWKLQLILFLISILVLAFGIFVGY
jgi:uncharacterized ion transporter superfamily protein YfcC